MHGKEHLEILWRNVRHALRRMRRSPGFTFVAVASLALGIGANTAIFSLIDTLMLRLLPAREPDQLVELLQKYPGEPRGNGFWSWQSYQYFRDYNHVFSGLIAFEPSRFEARGAGLEPGTVDGEYVVGSFFRELGLKPAIGRLISPEDDRMNAAGSIAVVSWSYWQTKFNLNPAILGKRIILNDVPITIIGVTPRAFLGLAAWYRPKIWVPLSIAPMIERSSNMSIDRVRLGLMARLKPGVSIAQARADMSVLYRFTIQERARTSKDPLVHQLKAEVEPAGAGLSELRDRFAKPLFLLMTVVGLLLLLACANLAGMLLARGAARQHEMAVRISLGAGRLQVMSHVLTETLLLSGAGGLAGVFLAYFGAGALMRILESGRQIPGMPVHLELSVHPDMHVLFFTGGIALLTGVLFGFAPAWSAFASTPASSLWASGRAAETKSRRLFGKSLVVAQVALSVVLLSAASLFIRHLSNLRNVHLGFRRDHVLLVTLDPTHSGYKGAQLSRAYQELLRHLEAIPGVRTATICAASPILGAGASRFVTVEGHQEKPENRRYSSLNWVAPKYFETLGTPLLAGRGFSFADEGRSPVAIINRAMARYYFGKTNPIGMHITLDGDEKGYQIVGVVGDAKYLDLHESPPRTIYLNAFQQSSPPSQFALWTSVKPAVVTREVRRLIRESLKTISLVKVSTLADQVDASIVPERLIATLSGLFGALGASLVAIGLYGLLAYMVARRINEIGIRMALGATQNAVIRMVFGDALAMLSAGLGIGVPLAFWGRRVAGSLMPDLPATSGVSIIFGTVAMVVVALLAAYVPALRAARVDPIEALRHE
jgi:predicted permease